MNHLTELDSHGLQRLHLESQESGYRFYIFPKKLAESWDILAISKVQYPPFFHIRLIHVEQEDLEEWDSHGRSEQTKFDLISDTLGAFFCNPIELVGLIDFFEQLSEEPVGETTDPMSLFHRMNREELQQLHCGALDDEVLYYYEIDKVLPHGNRLVSLILLPEWDYHLGVHQVSALEFITFDRARLLDHDFDPSESYELGYMIFTQQALRELVALLKQQCLPDSKSYDTTSRNR